MNLVSLLTNQTALIVGYVVIISLIAMYLLLKIRTEIRNGITGLKAWVKEAFLDPYMSPMKLTLDTAVKEQEQQGREMKHLRDDHEAVVRRVDRHDVLFEVALRSGNIHVYEGAEDDPKNVVHDS